MIIASKLMAAIDASWYRHEESRGYLGASSLGGSCSRELWYGFRWVDKKQFPPRVLRLFDRGNREENVFEALLHNAGVEFFALNPATKKQYVMVFDNKHVKGHCDGIGRHLPDLEHDEKFLGEWKTHNDRSFKELIKKGVQKSKPVHYTQCQLYMYCLDIKWALYGAVNKNDDHLHFELLAYDEHHVQHYLDRADRIVNLETPPDRISNNPGWYECKWCDFYGVCHKGKPLQVTCRSCVHVLPLTDGDWWCGLHDKILNIIEQRAGCGDHVVIEDTPF